MIRASGAARLGKDEDRLSPRHEIVGLGDVGTGRATLDLLPALPVDDDAPRASRDFRDHVGPEMREQEVERSRNRRYRAEPLDQLVARVDRFLAQDTVALVVKHRLGAHRSIGRAKGAHLARREGRSQIIDQRVERRSEEHTSELQSLMRISYAVFCLKKKNTTQ